MVPASPLALRIPTFPLNELQKLNANILANQDQFIHLILSLRGNKVFMNALYYASSRLHDAFIKASAEEEHDKINRICISVYKYFVRMCSRATPFGLFAGLGLAEVAEGSTAVNLDPENKGVAFVRYDMALVLSLSEELLRDDRLKKKVKYYVNNSIHTLRGKIRYIESEYNDGAKNYLVSDLERFPLLDFVVEQFATRGGGTFQEFLSYLEAQNLDLETAEDFFEQLIQNQILISELEINVTGEFYLERISDILKPLLGIEDLQLKIESLKEILHLLNQGSLSPLLATQKLTRDFKSLVAYNNYHVDYKIKMDQNKINKRVIEHLTKNLQKIISFLAQPVRNETLEKFKSRFIERYGEKEISLGLLLDPDIGIAYSETRVGKSPLIENILRTNRQQDHTYGAVSRIKNLFINKLIQRGQLNIELTDQDMVEFKKSMGDAFLSQSHEYYVLGSMVCDSAAEMDSLNYQFEIKTLVNGNAANLMARFGHFGEEFGDYISQHIKKDITDNPDWIDAEIVHLNAGEGNIVIRPSLVEYELPFACFSTKNTKFQLQISDIYVSLKNNAFVLRSKKHNKYIRARLHTAHNYTTGLPLYRFLCDIQSQGHASKLNWDWGILSELGMSPRVSYKGIILAKAKWKISRQSFSNLNFANFKNLLNELQLNKHLPDLVTLDVGDNELLLDLRLAIAKEILFSSLKNSGAITVSEYINKQLTSFIKHNDNSYANEILLSFSSPNESTFAAEPAIQRQISKAFKKTLIPFEDCLSLKIYCGERIAEYILANELAPLLKSFTNLNKSNYWFFIRYHDPDPHLRIRLFSADRLLLFNTYQLIEKKIASYVKDDIIFSLQIDTYKREFERYGRNSLLFFEHLFFEESCLIVTLLDSINNDLKDEDYRVFFVLRLCAIYLNVYFKSIEDKLEFTDKIKNSFVLEFKDTIHVKESLRIKYNDYKPYAFLIETEPVALNSDPQLNILLKHLSDFERNVASKIDYFKTETQLASILHMAINRIFIAEQRLHELFLYDILVKYYKSSIARSKKSEYAG
jgi:thiopeptide-type bacteriocin biosynthesis protein